MCLHTANAMRVLSGGATVCATNLPISKSLSSRDTGRLMFSNQLVWIGQAGQVIGTNRELSPLLTYVCAGLHCEPYLPRHA